MPAESPTLGLSHLQFEALLISARESPNVFDFACPATGSEAGAGPGDRGPDGRADLAQSARGADGPALRHPTVASFGRAVGGAAATDAPAHAATHHDAI